MLRTMLYAAAIVAGLTLSAAAAEPWATPPSPHALATARNSLFVPTVAPASAAAPALAVTAAPAAVRTSVVTPPVGVTPVGRTTSLFIGTPTSAVRSDSSATPPTVRHVPVAQPSRFIATSVSYQAAPATSLFTEPAPAIASAAVPSSAPAPAAAPDSTSTAVAEPTRVIYRTVYVTTPVYVPAPVYYYPPPTYYYAQPVVTYSNCYPYHYRPYYSAVYFRGGWGYPRHWGHFHSGPRFGVSFSYRF